MGCLSITPKAEIAQLRCRLRSIVCCGGAKLTDRHLTSKDPLQLSWSGRRTASVEKLRNSRDKLRWSEWLGQHNAVGYAMGWPFGCIATGHIDNWEFRVDLSGSLRDFPTVHDPAQLEVGHNRSIFALVSTEQGHRLLAGRGNCRFETAIGEDLLNDGLDRGVIFDDQNNNEITQRTNPLSCPQRVRVFIIRERWFPFQMYKSEHWELVGTQGGIHGLLRWSEADRQAPFRRYGLSDHRL